MNFYEIVPGRLLFFDELARVGCIIYRSPVQRRSGCDEPWTENVTVKQTLPQLQVGWSTQHAANRCHTIRNVQVEIAVQLY